MSKLELPPFGSVAALAVDRPLNDPSLPTSAVSIGLSLPPGPIGIPDPTAAGASLGSFSISAGASACVAIINSPADPDPEGYFNLNGTAKPAAENAADAPLIEAPLTYNRSLAYLVISRLSVTGKLSGNFSIGTPVALGLDGSAALDVSACFAFEPSTLCHQALEVAAGSFATVFSAAELAGLSLSAPGSPTPWQVVSVGANTSLSLSLKLTLASLASTIADSINSALNIGGPFTFTASPSASLTVSASVTDGFRLFAQRLQIGATTFSVKKTLATSRGIDASLGLSIGISENDLNALVNSVFDQVAGVADGAVQSILTPGATGGVLPLQQQQDLHAIISKLGLSNTAATELQSLQTKLAAMKADLGQRLRTTTGAQFSYSWKRLTTESHVAQFTVPDSVLPKYHAAILGFDLADIPNGVDGITYSRLLGQKSVETDVGFGFSFGIGGYTFLKSWDSLQTKFVELDSLGTDSTTLRQFSFLGKRAYALSWFGSLASQYVELDASMPQAVAAPSAADFQLGLSVAFVWQNQNLSDLVLAAADYGSVLQVFDSADIDASASVLRAAGVPATGTGDLSVSLTVSDLALRSLLPLLSNAAGYTSTLAPYALARALPYYAGHPERTNVDRRMRAYAQVWADFLATDDLSGGDTVARCCGRDLPQFTSGGRIPTAFVTAEREGIFAWTAQSVAAMSSQIDLQGAVNQLASGCFSLLARPSGDFRQVFPQCVSEFSDLAAQSYGARVFASILIIAGMNTPGGLGRLVRSVAFTWRDSGKTRVLVLKQGGN